MRTLEICVAPGIGDFAWVYAKLVTLGLPIKILMAPDGRLVELGSMLPPVTGVVTGPARFPEIRDKSVDPNISKANFLNLPNPIMIEANSHIESGTRLEKWLPEIELAYHYEIRLKPEHINQAHSLNIPKPYISIFGASDAGVAAYRAFGAWDAEDWGRFMDDCRIRMGIPNFAVVGAQWDKSLADRITEVSKRYGVDCRNFAGQFHLGTSLQIIKESCYFVGFPSGLSVLAAVLRCKATMFYPGFLYRMIGQWADPETIASNEFHESVYVEPRELTNWILGPFGGKGRLLC
jgi:hypothetical protein